jgi:hypothetical protein
MSVLNISAKLGLDTANYEKGLQKLKGKNKELEGSLNGVKGGIKGVINQFGGLGGTLQGVLGDFTSLGSSLDGLIGSFPKLARTAATSMGLVKAAFASTGIGAIVIAITIAIAGLVSWLKRSDEGSLQLAKAFNVVSSVVEVLLDRIALLGSAIVKLFKGDFKGAAEDARAVVTNIGSAIKDNIDKADKLTELQREYDLWNINHKKRLAELNVKASEYAKIMRDEVNYTAQERLQALNNYRALQNKINEEQRKNLEYQINIERTKQSLGYSSIEDRKKLADLEADLVNLNAELNNKVRETLRIEKTITNQIERQNEALAKTIENNTAKYLAEVSKEAEKITPIVDDSLNSINELFDFDAGDIELIDTEKIYNQLGVFKTALDTLKDTFSNFEAPLTNFRNSIANLNQLFLNNLAAGANSFREYGKQVITTVKNIISAMIAEGVMAVVTAQLKKYAFTGFGAALIAAATGGVVATTINSLASSLLNQKFASGGVVSGTNFYGDTVPILANSGEMILNKSQQNNLFRLLNSATSNSLISGEVRFEIEGEKLVGILERYNYNRI